ncbi:MAG TPA: zinc-binding dehydrogenase [Armatimonadota bacterium]|nr:zinc-binding dehydrogenase [Armatimonadota bacterium]
MRAIGIHEYGGLDRVQLIEVDEPTAADGEVVIDVRSAALNHLDVWVRNGRPGPGLPMPHILGSDAAGVITAVGEGVPRSRLGEEVVITPGLSCRRCEACIRGEHSECESFGIIGANRPGTFAERVAVPAYCAHPKPRALSFDQAAALPVAYLTSWRMLLSRAKLRPGESVLVHGVGGGVALAALQIAKLIGALVIVTSSSEEKLAKARALGADHSIDYGASPDVAGAVRELTDGRGVDVVVDTVGAATWPIDLSVVRKGGRVVLCGVTTGAEAPTDLRTVYWRQLSLLGSTFGNDEEFRLLLNATESAGLRPVIDSTYDIEDAADAMERMEAGKQFGKLVLRVPH